MGNTHTLKDKLALHKGETVYIGARSSFFFIGPAYEALEDLALISAMMKRIASLSRRASRRRKKLRINPEEGKKLGSRKVLNSYAHDMCGGGEVIIVEGNEFGAFWTRREYVAERERLLKTI